METEDINKMMGFVQPPLNELIDTMTDFISESKEFDNLPKSRQLEIYSIYHFATLLHQSIEIHKSYTK